MMNNPDVLVGIRPYLADAVAQSRTPAANPLKISPWLAMSCLQKAVRRGCDDLALRAAATLHETDPARLWRRCCGIAFEDIGVADIVTVSLVTGALAGKRFRAHIGGEWQVASYIVARMARAPKCRAADDLLMTAELHPDLRIQRQEFPKMATSELLGLMCSAAPLPERALAMWFALGTNRWNSRHLPPRRGEPRIVFDHLCELVGSHFAEIARDGYRRGAGVLAPLVMLLASIGGFEPGFNIDDNFPAELLIGSVPSWAYDIYSHEGRRALEAFSKAGCASASWVGRYIRPAQRMKFLGSVLFRCEGGKVRQRLRWPIGDELRRIMDFEGHGPQCPDATEILSLLHDDIPALNEVRRHV